MTSQFLLFHDAPTGVHQVLAFNMIYGIAPFKMQESEVIQLPNEMKGAKDARSIIQLHSGKQILCVDTFQELVEAMSHSGVIAYPKTATRLAADGPEWNLKTEFKEPSAIQVVTAESELAVSALAEANSLPKH